MGGRKIYADDPGKDAGATREIGRLRRASSSIGDFLSAISIPNIPEQDENGETSISRAAFTGVMVRIVASICFSTMDMVTDLMLAVEYKQKGESSRFRVTLSLIILQCSLQVLFTYITKQGWLRTLLAATGLKHILESFEVLTGKGDGMEGAVTKVQGLAFSRALEVIFESCPQSAVQIFFYFNSPSSMRTWLQRFTISTSLLATGFVVSNLDYDMDASKKYRRMEPRVYGYYPEKKPVKLFFLFLSMVAVSSNSFFSLFSLTLSINAFGYGIASLVVVLELSLLTLVRYGVNNLVYFDRQMRNFVTIFLIPASYVAMRTAPFLTLRQPWLLGARVSSLCLLYSFCSNWFQYLIIYEFTDRSASFEHYIPRERALLFATAVSGMIAFTYLSLFLLTKTSHRFQLWMKHSHPSEHFSSFVWNTTCYLGNGNTLDGSRARALVKWNPRYWDTRRVQSWLKHNWSEWHRERPKWFTDEWISEAVPRSMVPRDTSARRPPKIAIEASASPSSYHIIGRDGD